MELSPQSVALTTFKTVKKGYDPNEVRAYLARLATAIESTQTQAAAMEARARAAVARLQELAGQPAAARPPAPEPAVAAVAPVAERDTTDDEAQTISRTLLLAQRTADATIAEANADAKRIREEAEEIAGHARDSAEEIKNRLVEEAKADARRASEDQRVQIDSEVQSLLARREFLLSDVEHLEQHVISHRDRLREVAASLTTIVESPNGGLADLRRPLTSAVTASDETEPQEQTMPVVRVPTLAGSVPALALSDDAEAVDAVDAVDDASADASGDVEDRGDEDASVAAPAPGDPTPAAGTFSPSEPDTSQVPSATRTNNDLFSIGGEELR
jgi:DivIVA domain-containing protein